MTVHMYKYYNLQFQLFIFFLQVAMAARGTSGCGFAWSQRSNRGSLLMRGVASGGSRAARETGQSLGGHVHLLPLSLSADDGRALCSAKCL